jgi:hypothetical protein
MKSRFTRAIGGMAAAVLVMSMLTVYVMHGQASQTHRADGSAESVSSGKRRIVGVWVNQVSIIDCDSKDVLVTFAGLLTYHVGGTLSETTGDTFLRSPGSGTWHFRGRQRYGGKFMFFTFNPDGSPSGFFKVFQNIQLSESGDEPPTRQLSKYTMPTVIWPPPAAPERQLHALSRKN